MELKLGSWERGVTQWRWWQGGDDEEEECVCVFVCGGGISNFPINHYYRTNKLQSGTFILAITPSVPNILWLSKSRPLCYKGGSCPRQPRRGTTFTRKPVLPVNRADFLWADWDLALGPGHTHSFSPFLAVSRSLSPAPSPLLRKIVVFQRQLADKSAPTKAKCTDWCDDDQHWARVRKKKGLLVIKIQWVEISSQMQ